MYNNMNSIDNSARHPYSYQPMPVYDDQRQATFHFGKQSAVKYKMDLNLYCIKKPKQTFFMRVNNPHLTSWGIEQGDMLVIEETAQIIPGDLVVIEQNGSLQLYEFFSAEENNLIFFSLDSKHDNLRVPSLQQVRLQGVITNTIHQFRGRIKGDRAA
ncbi:LexA family protein [Testudinibacter sp. TR-2022]|uniref:LexA family protein n=1 Tax=Testudinibacter sp. TR-2022 TaxID=2585029 RepID=UPI0022779C2A|nr:S24 family peptidase [Testudinibacter sp. TR-2022]